MRELGRLLLTALHESSEGRVGVPIDLVSVLRARWPAVASSEAIAEITALASQGLLTVRPNAGVALTPDGLSRYVELVTTGGAPPPTVAPTLPGPPLPKNGSDELGLDEIMSLIGGAPEPPPGPPVPMTGPLPSPISGPISGPLPGPISGPLPGPLPGQVTAPLSGPIRPPPPPVPLPLPRAPTPPTTIAPALKIPAPVAPASSGSALAPPQAPPRSVPPPAGAALRPSQIAPAPPAGASPAPGGPAPAAPSAHDPNALLQAWRQSARPGGSGASGDDEDDEPPTTPIYRGTPLPKEWSGVPERRSIDAPPPPPHPAPPAIPPHAPIATGTPEVVPSAVRLMRLKNELDALTRDLAASGNLPLEVFAEALQLTAQIEGALAGLQMILGRPR